MNVSTQMCMHLHEQQSSENVMSSTAMSPVKLDPVVALINNCGKNPYVYITDTPALSVAKHIVIHNQTYVQVLYYDSHFYSI